MRDTTETWFNMETEADGEFITITAMQGEHTTGAAVAFPMDAAPFIAHGLLELWCVEGGDDSDEVELDEDGWPYEDGEN